MAQGKRKQASRKTVSKPVTAHPLFPAIVALWFGALFGLGSMAIRPALLESLVLKLHIDLVIPAAAPPLGMTARILLSIGMALVGGIIGALIARRIARPKPEVRERRRGAGAPARESQQAWSVAPDAPAARRRALAVEEDYEPTYHHEYAPLPGGAPQILDVSEFDFAQEEQERAFPVAAAEAAAPAPVVAGALDLSGFLAGEAVVPEPAVQPEPAPFRSDPFPPAPAFQALPVQAPAEPAFTAPARSFDAPPLQPAPEPARFDASPADEPIAPSAGTRPFAAPLESAPLARPAAVEAAIDEPATPESQDEDNAVDRIHAAALEALSQVELIERLARALQRRRDLAGSTAPVAYAAPVMTKSPAEGACAAATVAPFAAPEAVEPTAVEAPVAAPVEGLSAPAPAVDSAPETAAPEIAAPETAAPEIAAPEPIVVPPIAMPAALRPIGLDLVDDDGDDDLAAFLPPRHITMPAASAPELPVAPAEAPAPFASPLAEPAVESEDDVLSDGYSSLLDLSRPAPLRASFVRIEEPEEEVAAPEPVVVFPGQAQRFAASQPAAEPFASTPSAPAAAMAAPAEGAAPLRRFDAPASAMPAAQSVAAAPISAGPAPVQDREEAERALRTALATLQRMSATG